MCTRVADIWRRLRTPPPVGAPRARPRGSRLVYPALAVLAAVLSTAAISSSVVAQTDDDVAEQVRIMARKLADGRIEFGLQQHRDGAWSERLLPTNRFFPAAATVGRWLSSSPLTLGVAATPYVTPSNVEMRIVARRLADGRTEFALQLRQHDTSWGERLRPARRMFPTDTDAGRWLVSTPLAAHLAPRAARNYQLPEGAADLVDIRVSGLDACGLHSDGAVSCWGSNEWSQCERRHTICLTHFSEDQVFAPAGKFSAIYSAGDGLYALRADGTVTCWYGSSRGCNTRLTGTFSTISVTTRDGFCGIRRNGSVACSGSNSSNPPGGTFIAIAAGNRSCGIRTNGSVACWGGRDQGRVPAPAGTFTSLSAGQDYVCGIRTAGSVVCWGHAEWDPSRGTGTGTLEGIGAVTCGYLIRDGGIHCSLRLGGGPTGNEDGQADPPEGTFTAISAGLSHACGIRTDGSATCWGNNSHGQASAPAGDFTAISTTGTRSCGVRTNGTATCWGMGIVKPPAGSFTAISTGVTSYSGQPDHTCGIRTDGTISCWGSGPPEPPSGTFTAVTASLDHACGLRSDSTATCWGRSKYGSTNAPGGMFTTIGTGETHTCGLRANGIAICWGGNRPALRDAPDGVFAALEVGPFHTCGLRTDGTLDCWGLGYTIPLGHGWGYITPASGTFSSLSIGFASCALRGDGTATCWSRDGTRTPDETFTAISDSGLHTCGIRLNGTVTCWPTHSIGNLTGQADALEGSFIAVAAGYQHTCGIREDRSLACWGAVRGGHTIWHITKQ